MTASVHPLPIEKTPAYSVNVYADGTFEIVAGGVTATVASISLVMDEFGPKHYDKRVVLHEPNCVIMEALASTRMDIGFTKPF